MPVDFDLAAHIDERIAARAHLASLSENDVVVYDRGYFSYAFLYEQVKLGIHPIFRIKTGKRFNMVDLAALRRAAADGGYVSGGDSDGRGAI